MTVQLSVKIKGDKVVRRRLANLEKRLPAAAKRARARWGRIMKRNMVAIVRKGAWPKSSFNARKPKLSRSFRVRTKRSITVISSQHPAAAIVDRGGSWTIPIFKVHDSSGEPLGIVKKNYKHRIRGKHYVDRAGKRSLPEFKQVLRSEFDIRKLTR